MADLRDEVEAEGLSERERERVIEAVLAAGRGEGGTGGPEVGLSELDRALCEYARKLTLQPDGMTAADLGRLRELGLDDSGLHAAIQVVAYFNYINRVADAVHVDLEPEMPAYPGAD